MAPRIRTPLEASLFRDMIPQISEEEPFIRHALIAIGAVCKFSNQTGVETFQPIDENNIGTLDFTFALKEYGKALAGMRQAIANNLSDMRKAFIACLLVFCFETLAWKPTAALPNAMSGLMLLYQSCLSRLKSGVIFNYPEHVQTIEGPLMVALGNIDLHVLFYKDTRPLQIHQNIFEGADKAIQIMPREFTELPTARHCWCLLMRRNFHFLRIVLTEGRPEELAGPWPYSSCKGPWEDAENFAPGEAIYVTPSKPPMEMYPACHRYREQTSVFIKACEQLFTEIRETGTEEEKVVISMIRAHELMTQVMLAGACNEPIS